MQTHLLVNTETVKKEVGLSPYMVSSLRADRSSGRHFLRVHLSLVAPSPFVFLGCTDECPRCISVALEDVEVLISVKSGTAFYSVN